MMKRGSKRGKLRGFIDASPFQVFLSNLVLGVSIDLSYFASFNGMSR